MEQEFNANTAVFVALAEWVAKRDGITPDEAAERLGNLFNSPEVQAQVAEEAAAKEAPVVDAENSIQTAVAEIEASFDKLRESLGL